MSKYKDKHPRETVAERKARVQAERIALAKQRSKNPGRSWRVLAQDLVDGRPISMQDRGEFDEVCVDDWLHVERMDKRSWWAQVGDAYVWITIPTDGGRVRVDIRRGEYGDTCGDTKP